MTEIEFTNHYPRFHKNGDPVGVHRSCKCCCWTQWRYAHDEGNWRPLVCQSMYWVRERGAPRQLVHAMRREEDGKMEVIFTNSVVYHVSEEYFRQEMSPVHADGVPRSEVFITSLEDTIPF